MDTSLEKNIVKMDWLIKLCNYIIIRVMYLFRQLYGNFSNYPVSFLWLRHSLKVNIQLWDYEINCGTLKSLEGHTGRSKLLWPETFYTLHFQVRGVFFASKGNPF